MLEHEIIRGSGETTLWVLMLHGIFGSGRNWGAIARRLTELRPEIACVLVDLREHGKSKGFKGPHTLAAAASDVRILVETLRIGDHAVLGHSFGGKVAMRYAELSPPGLGQVWVVDSTPAVLAAGGASWEALGLMRRLHGPFETRGEVTALIEAAGFGAAMAQWLVGNLERTERGLVWRLDLDAMEQLLRDFYAADLWHIVERHASQLHFVKATRSDLLTAEAVQRIAATGAALHEVEGGHWVHAENPDAMARLLAEKL